jgi:pimeloyl-ACP methyl ester carboxylesterase
LKNRFLHIIIFALIAIACSKQNSDSKERFMFRNGDADMMVLVEGNIASKTFILLLHGGPGGDGSIYNIGTYSDLLEEQYAMVYWDQRGQGASQGKYHVNEVNVKKMAFDTYELAKLLKAKYGNDINLFLMGHSWGGMLGTAALVETEIQTIIDGWIDVDGAHNIPMLNKEAIKMFEIAFPQGLAQDPNHEFWLNVKALVDTVDTNNISVSAGGLINDYGHEAEQYISNISYDNDETEISLYDFVFKNPTSPYHSYIVGTSTSNLLFNEVENKSYSRDLDQINIPCLFQWGGFDFVVPPALGIEAYNKVSTPDAQKALIIYEHSGHSPMVNEPQEFVNDVVSFIERFK